jgi:hypothetical protein
MKNLLTATAALAVFALAGCSAAAPNVAAGTVTGTNGALGVLPAEQLVDMTAHLDITGPGGYRVQTLTAWNLSDIDHVKLTLYKNGTVVTTKSVARANLATALTFSNLKMATTYKILAQAFSDTAEATQIDNTAEAGADTANAVTFTTPSLVAATAGDNVDDSTRTITVPVKLKNKTFAGNANSGSGVTVTNGTIVNTGNTESF